MAFKFLIFHLITAMVAVNLIFADEDSERSFPFSSFFGGGANGSSGLPNLPNLPNIPGLSNLPFFGSFGDLVPSFFESRQERSADHDEEEGRSIYGNVVSCNFTTQGRRSCTSCNQTLVCFRNNVGIVRTCRGLRGHCNNGRCSFNPSSQCNGTSNANTTSHDG